MTDATPVATRDCEVAPAPSVVDVPVGGRVLLVSDLHLAPEPTPGHLLVVAELALAIESWNGPGVVVFNGNTFEGVVRTERFTLEVAATKACVRASTGSPSTATPSASTIRRSSTPISAPRWVRSW